MIKNWIKCLLVFFVLPPICHWVMSPCPLSNLASGFGMQETSLKRVWLSSPLLSDNVSSSAGSVFGCVYVDVGVWVFVLWSDYCVCVCVSISLMAYGCPWGVRWSSPSLLEQGLRGEKKGNRKGERGYMRGKWEGMMRPSYSSIAWFPTGDCMSHNMIFNT